jgi:hypothetical protein
MQNLKETPGHACVSIAKEDKSEYNTGNVKNANRMAYSLRDIVKQCDEMKRKLLKKENVTYQARNKEIGGGKQRISQIWIETT